MTNYTFGGRFVVYTVSVDNDRFESYVTIYNVPTSQLLITTGRRGIGNTQWWALISLN